jgi:hypothetical protein
MRCHRLVFVLLILLTVAASAQNFSGSSSRGTTKAKSNPIRITIPKNTRVADERGNASGAMGNAGDALSPPASKPGLSVAGPLKPVAIAGGEPSLGRITKGTGALPNDGGQVWREYDLTPYTSKVTGVDKPEQAVIDWVLRETGTEVWFGAPLGILSADKTTLRVYHTPEIQEAVKGIYDRFMATSAAANRLSIRVVTISNPNWRSRAVALLKPIDVKSAGVEAWLATHDNAVLLSNELRKRADYRERAAPVVDIPNGQTYPLGLTQPRQYMRSVRPNPQAPQGFEPELATLNEGYSLEISPLTSVDGRSLDVVVKCNVDQVEKMIEVPLDIPAPLGQTQRMSIQVPQLVSWRLHERFRWPSDQVLILSCGVVATPTNDKAAMPLLGPLVTKNRADALLIIEPISGNAVPASPALPGLPAASAVRPTFGPTRPPFTASPLLPPSSHLR